MKTEIKLLTRRDFIRGTVSATLAASVAGMPWGDRRAHAAGSSVVTVVRDKNVMSPDLRVNVSILQAMLDQTVINVTGKAVVKDAWAVFVKPDDTVGLVDTPFMNPTHSELVEAVKTSLIKYTEIPEMGRFAVRDMGRTVAVGIVKDIETGA